VHAIDAARRHGRSGDVEKERGGGDLVIAVVEVVLIEEGTSRGSSRTSRPA